MIKYIRRTTQRFSHSKLNKEYVVMADGPSTTRNFEDKPILGPRQEPDGTTLDLNMGKGVFNQGSANLLEGTTAGLLGGNEPGNTPRGNNVQTTKPRRVFMHFDEALK